MRKRQYELFRTKGKIYLRVQRVSEGVTKIGTFRHESKFCFSILDSFGEIARQWHHMNRMHDPWDNLMESPRPRLRHLIKFADYFGLSTRKAIKALVGEYDVEIRRPVQGKSTRGSALQCGSSLGLQKEFNQSLKNIKR